METRCSCGRRYARRLSPAICAAAGHPGAPWWRRIAAFWCTPSTMPPSLR
jgi:hypothetical protein